MRGLAAQISHKTKSPNPKLFAHSFKFSGEFNFSNAETIREELKTRLKMIQIIYINRLKLLQDEDNSSAALKKNKVSFTPQPNQRRNILFLGDATPLSSTTELKE